MQKPLSRFVFIVAQLDHVSLIVKVRIISVSFVVPNSRENNDEEKREILHHRQCLDILPKVLLSDGVVSLNVTIIAVLKTCNHADHSYTKFVTGFPKTEGAMRKHRLFPENKFKF